MAMVGERKGGVREWGALKGIEGRPREAGGMAGERTQAESRGEARRVGADDTGLAKCTLEGLGLKHTPSGGPQS